MGKIESISPGGIIVVPPGTELNFNRLERGNFLNISVPTKLKVLGQVEQNALPVQIIFADGREDDRTLFFHQPEPSLAKT